MKITVLGGGSFSTPAMFAALRSDFTSHEFTLVGRSEENLKHVVRASQMLSAEYGPKITPIICDAGSSALALQHADVVLIQMRIGDLAGRDFDETFPLTFGLCGDEGLGAGGVSAAWRSWPKIEEWLKAIEQHAPRALVLMMSSPVGVLTRAAQVKFPQLNCLGICEVPYIALRDMCTLLSADLASLRFDYLGVNHIGWLYGVRSGDRDLVREWAELPHRTGFPATEIIMKWGGVPTKYLRLHFEPDAVIAAQRSARVSRAHELELLQQAAFSSYAYASTPELRESLSRRPTPWYSESIVPLLRGLCKGCEPGPFFLSGRNGRQVTACAADDILEIGCRVENHKIARICPTESPPPAIAQLISRFCRHERLATEAVTERNVPKLEKALSTHPWIEAAVVAHPGDLASALAKTIVAQHT